MVWLSIVLLLSTVSTWKFMRGTCIVDRTWRDPVPGQKSVTCKRWRKKKHQSEEFPTAMQVKLQNCVRSWPGWWGALEKNKALHDTDIVRNLQRKHDHSMSAKREPQSLIVSELVHPVHIPGCPFSPKEYSMLGKSLPWLSLWLRFLCRTAWEMCCDSGCKSNGNTDFSRYKEVDDEFKVQDAGVNNAFEKSKNWFWEVYF